MRHRQHFSTVLADAGPVAGIKVDLGTKPLAEHKEVAAAMNGPALAPLP